MEDKRAKREMSGSLVNKKILFSSHMTLGERIIIVKSIFSSCELFLCIEERILRFKTCMEYVHGIKKLQLFAYDLILKIPCANY